MLFGISLSMYSDHKLHISQRGCNNIVNCMLIFALLHAMIECNKMVFASILIYNTRMIRHFDICRFFSATIIIIGLV